MPIDCRFQAGPGPCGVTAVEQFERAENTSAGWLRRRGPWDAALASHRMSPSLATRLMRRHTNICTRWTGAQAQTGFSHSLRSKNTLIPSWHRRKPYAHAQWRIAICDTQCGPVVYVMQYSGILACTRWSPASMHSSAPLPGRRAQRQSSRWAGPAAAGPAGSFLQLSGSAPRCRLPGRGWRCTPAALQKLPCQHASCSAALPEPRDVYLSTSLHLPRICMHPVIEPADMKQAVPSRSSGIWARVPATSLGLESGEQQPETWWHRVKTLVVRHGHAQCVVDSCRGSCRPPPASEELDDAL